jgi:hypothetical protein
MSIEAVTMTALAHMDPTTPVKVSASGSQWLDDWNKPADQKTGKKTNTVSLSIQPIYGFVE